MLNEKKIYILFTDTGTLLSKAIRLYTGTSLNHSSIAFDKDLSTIYSFGRKDPRNPLIGGFVKESLYGSLIRQGQSRTQCAIYCCTVTKEQHNLILEEIQRVEKQQSLYKYNFLGLFGVALNVGIKREKAYFCTQFVATVFRNAGIELVSKPACLTTPIDLENSSVLEKIYEGDLRDYASSIPAAAVLKGGSGLPA